MPAARRWGYLPTVNDQRQPTPAEDGQARRVELARRAFKEFYAQCFWSYRRDWQVEEEDIPWLVEELRLNGGHKGYRMATQLLCP